MQIASPQTLFQKQKVYKIDKERSLSIQKEPHKVIVLYEHEAAELPSTLLEMLNKLIQACRLKSDEVCYVNHKFNPISLADIQAKYKTEVVLVFGEIKLSNNLAGLKKNYPFEINGVKILRTETLSNLERIKTEKAALWGSLQQIFNLK